MGILISFVILYTTKNSFQSNNFLIYSVSLYEGMDGYASWMRPVAMNAWHRRRESSHYNIQGSGLVRTVGPCAQSRVPQAIAIARDVLSNDRRKSAARFKRPAKQVPAVATEP